MTKITIKQKILKVLADGKPHHYRDIAKKIKGNAGTVSVVLRNLRMRGQVVNPELVITTKRAGVFQLPSI